MEGTQSREVIAWIAPEVHKRRQHGIPVVDYSICPVCRVSFGRNSTSRAKGQKYCSQACHGAAMSKRVERECKQCGSSFLVRRYSITQGWGQFCSNPCQYQYQRENAADLYHKGTYVTCRECGNDFYHHPREDGKHFGYFCSRRCSARFSEGKGRKSPGTRSGYRGVYPGGRGSTKWVVSIRHHGKLLYFGLYDDPKEAARVYDREAKRLQGEHAILNFPDTGARPSGDPA
jgi:hypothetical protein